MAVGSWDGGWRSALEVEACAEILEGFKEGGEAGEGEAFFGECFGFADVVDLVFHDAASVVFHFLVERGVPWYFSAMVLKVLPWLSQLSAEQLMVMRHMV
ncbi:MAG: hypothetical protein HC860_00765 [Alkalinema sp. RU_4_3]|nr:hypothetical protein [Alkalinema sp. RU_4_3]